MKEKNKIDFIKDNLDKLSDTQVDDIVKLLAKACIPRKAFCVDVKIDTDMDFVIIEENGHEAWDFEVVKYFDTEDECFKWLKDFTDRIKYKYDEKKALVEWVQEEILKIVKKRDTSLYISGNQIIDIDISKSFHKND